MIDGSRKRRLAGFAALSAAYFTGYLVLDSTTRTFQTLPGVSPWYPPNALSLALLLVFGLRMFPLVLLASILSNTLVWDLEISPAHILILSSIPAAGYLAGAAVMKRWLNLEPRLSSPQQVVRFIAFALLLPLPIAAAEAFESVQARLIAGPQYGDAVIQYWVGDVVGILTLVPFLTITLVPFIQSLLQEAVAREPRALHGERLLEPRRVLEVLAIGAATLLFGWTILDLELLGSPPLLYPLFLPLMWSAMRFGMAGAASANLGVGITSMFFISSGGAIQIDVSELQLFISLLSASGLILGSVVSQERTAERALVESEERYRKVFESTSECMIVLDAGHQIVDANAAAARLFDYRQRRLKTVDPMSLIGSSYRRYFEEYLARAIDGDALHLRLQCVKRSGQTFEASLSTTPIIAHGALRVLVLVRDITQEVRMLELLEEQVEQRTRELRALLNASRSVAENAELDQSVPSVMQALQATVPVEVAQIYQINSEGCVHLGSFTSAGHQWHRRLLSTSEIQTLSQATGLTLSVSWDDADVQEIDPGRGDEDGRQSFVLKSHSIAVPLVASNQRLGLLHVKFPMNIEPTDDVVRLVNAFADQLSMALQNARLLEESANRLEDAIRRREVSESLANIMHAVNQDLTLPEVLQAIVEQAAHALHPDGVALFRVAPGGDGLVIQASLGFPEEFQSMAGLPMEFGAVGRAVQANKPVLLTNLKETLTEDVHPRAAHRHQAIFQWIFDSFDSILSVPLRVRGESYGGISLYYRNHPEMGQEQVDLAVAFSAQAAVALENSRLADQSRRLAALQERQRIARDLHDSVSQSLYGLSLGARTAQSLAKGHDPDLEQALAYILELADSSLNEMRSLIFELRPEALREQGLRAALQRMTTSLAERHSVDIQLQLDRDLTLDASLEEALFRITQEGVHNALKHSGTSLIEVRIAGQDGYVQLEIQDYGRGFDPDSTPSGHFGLSTMRERAAAHDGQLIIESHSGQGTLIRAMLPRPKPPGGLE